MQAPIQPSGNSARDPSDAPQAMLTRDRQVHLAQYALGCKEGSIERDQRPTANEGSAGDHLAARVELDAAKKSAKGGGVWQRAKRIAKWGGVFGATGYLIGKTQR